MGDLLDADRLIETASDRAGLDDFGPPTFRIGLDKLLECIASEGALSELGAAITPDILVGYLTNRLSIIDWHAEHPEAAATDPHVTNHIVSIAQQLRDQLGAKVEIKLKGKEKGRIVIDFETNDEFERIVRHLRAAA